MYRSYGGENLKGRPPFYSKDLALWSLLRAAQSAAVRPTFLNDGPIPEARLDVMGSRGEVRSLSQRPAGMRSSYWSALRFAARSSWPDDDVVLFSEDDYLYTPDALVRLAEAADALPGVSYFAPYASTPRLPSAEFPRGYAAPPGWAAGPPVEVGGSTGCASSARRARSRQGWGHCERTHGSSGLAWGPIGRGCSITRPS
ncbi:MAG: hypothetical protein V9F82_00840 [Dermatophilaceae bacterium]